MATDSNNIKLVKFATLIEDIEEGFPSNLSSSVESIFSAAMAFEAIAQRCSPLLLIFDNPNINAYTKIIIENAQKIGYLNCDAPDLSDPEKGLTVTKKFIKEYRVPQYRKKALMFIFWSLLALAADKDTYEEKAALIADFACLLNIDTDTLESLIEAVKMVCGEDYNRLSTEVDNLFKNVL